MSRSSAIFTTQEKQALTIKEDGPSLHREGLIEADVDVLKVRPDRVQPVVFLPLHL